MPWFLLNLKAVAWKKIGVAVGAGAVLFLVVYVYLQGVALRQAELAYRNPGTLVVERRTRAEGPTTRVEGPTRTETRETRRPDGTVERHVIETKGQVTETKGPVTETTEATRRSTPVFPPAPRDFGWIIGLGTDRVASRQARESAFYGGYRLPGGRLDLLARVDGTSRLGVALFWRF